MKLRKFAYILGLLIVLLVNCLFINYEFMIVLCILVIIPFISWIVYKFSLMGMKLYVSNDNLRYTYGSNLDVIIWFGNKFNMKIPWCRCKVIVSYSNSEEEYENEVTFQGLKQFQKNIIMNVNLEHIGFIMVHVCEFEVRDYLGMFSKKIQYNTQNIFYIFPDKIETIETQINYIHQEDQYTLSHIEFDNTEVQDLRNIVEGDSLNHIHWKRSILSEDFIVKQFGEELKKHHCIVLDLSWHNEQNFRHILDNVYRLTYSVANTYINAGIGTSFIYWDSKKGDIELFDFDNIEGLYEAMETIMQINCNSYSFDLLLESVLLEKSRFGENIIVITSNDYKIVELNVFNVVERFSNSSYEQSGKEI